MTEAKCKGVLVGRCIRVSFANATIFFSVAGVRSSH